jgi:cytochrome c peroxidase
MRKWYVIAMLVLLCLGYSWLLQSCKKSGVDVAASDHVAFVVPAGFPQPHYDFTANPLTQSGIDLGRRLFYDGRLSKDGNFPCASCHQQFDAFATYDHDLSHGFNNAFTTRNAPGLANLAWEQAFQWDGGVNNIEVQPLAPLTAPNEMAETIDNVIAKLKADSRYPSMFKSAFGDETINSQRMLKALSQFLLSLVSSNSKYDRVVQGRASFDAQEQAGYVFFKANCASCHTEPMFTDHSYRNNGLALSSYLKDYGRMKITGNAADSLKFKVPSLRNVNITYPYMHDGRFWFLSQVLDHYSTGIVQSATLDPSLKKGIPMSYEDKQNVLAFLRTLTDSSFLNNPNFSQPPK